MQLFTLDSPQHTQIVRYGQPVTTRPSPRQAIRPPASIENATAGATHHPAATSRRSLLLGSLGLLAAGPVLSACTNPRIDGAPQTPPAPVTRAPHPQQEQILAALQSESDLAGLTRASTPAQSQAHQLHLFALQAAEPQSRPDSAPTPDFRHTPPPVPAAGTGQRLTDRAGQASATYQQTAHQQDPNGAQGQLALFWASLATFAAAEAARTGFEVLPPPPVRPMATRPEPEVWADLVINLDAAVYAAQTALAFLNRGDAQTARDNLADLRDSADALTAWLRAAGKEAPTAAAVYELPHTPHDAPSALALLAEVNSSLLPHLGQWVAASVEPRSRELAVRRLVSAGVTIARSGGGLTAWPGWA